MTLTNFFDLLEAYTEAQGQSFLANDVAGTTDLINREAKRFAQETLCLYSDTITMTLTASTAKYSMRDTAVFSKMVIEPTHLWVNGNLKTRVSTAPDMAGLNPHFHSASDAEPGYWYTSPPYHIVLRPAPASAYSNSRVEGWYFPDDVDYPDEGEDDPSLEFADEDIDPFAVHCAIALMTPRATGELLERVNYLRQLNAAQKAQILSRSEGLLQPAPIRRASSRVYSLR